MVRGHPPKPLTAISDAEIRRLVLFRPNGRLGDHYWIVGHIPMPVLLVGAVIAVALGWKLRRFILAAFGG